MSIALVCDVPYCDEVISQEDTDAIIEKFGEDKPHAIEVLIDGEEYMFLDDACQYHRNQFKRMIGDFLVGTNATLATEKLVEKAAEQEKVEVKTSRKRQTAKIPGGIEVPVIDAKAHKANASELAVKPSDLFSDQIDTKEQSKPEESNSEPQKASQPAKKTSSVGAPKKFVRTSQREKAKEQNTSMSGVASLEDEGVETIIEPSMSAYIDFSGTTPVA